MKQTDRFCSEIKASAIPTFIWGAAEMAHLVEARLLAQNVMINGLAVDDECLFGGGA